MSLLVNGLTVNSMRFHATWSGVWSAELDYVGDVSPFGKVAIASTEGIAAVATVDPERSGVFGEKRHLRVLGGGGGWAKSVRAQHFHSDIGVALQVLASTTATEVGEVATVILPSVVGVDFVRRAGPAAQIFEDAGVDWWVGLDGVTRIGVRTPMPAPPSLTVLDWQPENSTVSFTCDVLVEPGAILVDPRFGTKIVREVDALVSGGSVTGTLWVADAAPEMGSVSELVDGIGALAIAATRAAYGRVYEYRVITMAGDRVELQAVAKADGVPDVLPASVWAGISGYRATLTPMSRALVGFVAGDQRRPYLAAYEPPEGGGWRPVKLELDATANVAIGEQAATVTIGSPLSARPVARLTPTFATWIAAVSAYINGLAPGTAIPPVDIASTKVVSS